jgi:quercetin dioxygenase-like cupin family protein
MPVLFNHSDVKIDTTPEGVDVQHLITSERVGSDFIQLDRWSLVADLSAPMVLSAQDLAWFQLLEGTAILDGNTGKFELSTAHMVFLPPGYTGTLTAANACVVLYGRVPDAAKYDPEFANHPPGFHCVNWREEPVLDSEHDARQRIYMVTPTLFGTKAVKGEMIIYPPGTEASNHHHEGAEHFQYIISGEGTAYLSEVPHPMRAGDTLYNYENERHYFINNGNEDLIFVEYFVPADCKTVWVNPELVCAWIPTGKNIEGGEPVREIKAHSSAETVNPEGV